MRSAFQIGILIEVMMALEAEIHTGVSLQV